MELKMEEPVKVQERTEKRFEELTKLFKNMAEYQKQIREELGGLSKTFGYTLENEAYKKLPALLEKDFGIQIKQRLIRKYITDDKGNKTTYEYDHQNRIKKIIYPGDCFVFKLPAEASHWLPAPVEKTNLLTTPLNNLLIVSLALRLREGDIISRLCLAE